MSDELVKRLRDCANGSTWLFKTHQGDFGICDEAADRIEALTAERDEAINQLDSARYSVEVLEKRVKSALSLISAVLKERPNATPNA